MKTAQGNIITWFIQGKKFIYLFIVVAMAVGVAGLLKMNKGQLPTFKIKQGLVAAVLPGATAEQINEQVAKPLEDVLFSISEVDRKSLTTVCRDGICYMYVDLVVEHEMKDEVWSKIKHTLNSAKLKLPPTLAALAVLDDFSEVSALLIALESDDKGNLEMKRYAEELCLRLRAIPTLAKAEVIGGQNEEIAVTLDSDRLSDYAISPASLMLGYRSATLSGSGGFVGVGNANLPIHIENPVTSEQEIEDYIIYSDDAGSVLRLRDVASVERRIQPDSPSLAYNGHTAVVVNVCMRERNNIVEFGEEVDKVLSEFCAGLPDSVHVSRITDRPKDVRFSIMNFLRDLIVAMLVVFLMMLLLFPFRSALIASSGVPVCIFVTMAVMYMTGMELNTVTLAAMIVVLGMIVDDSIITMDGYMMELVKDSDRVRAASRSAMSLFMPMFIATTGIALMFFPCPHIISGYFSDFTEAFPWVVAIALFCSLAYAMLVVPSLEVKFIKSPHSDKNAFSKVQGRFFNALQKMYEKCEAFCFKRPALTIAGGITAVILGILMFSQVNIQMFPSADSESFTVEVSLDNNSTIAQTRAVSDSLTALLLKDSRIESVTSFVGQSVPRFQAMVTPAIPGPNKAVLIVNTSSTTATVDLIEEYEGKYEHIFPNASVFFRQFDYKIGKSVEVVFTGRSTDDIKPCADSLLNFMHGMSDELKGIHSEQEESAPFVKITLNPEAAAKVGADKTLLSLSLLGAVNGRSLADIYEGTERVPVNLYSSSVSDTMQYSDLGNILLPSLKPGVNIPLAQVAEITPAWRKSKVTRYGGQESIAVYGDMKALRSQPVAMKKVKAFIEDRIRPNLPEGASLRYSGLESYNSIHAPEIGRCFIVAVFILFLFLLIHFRKIRIAVLTLLLSLLCLFGASFGLWLFEMDLTVPAVLGLISLVGIVVRNGIIMFDYAEYLRREEGLDAREAALLAGQRRMRPIFLTSCTTALGVLPMILNRDALWMPMGLVICFGTLMSIALIVLVMPVSYWQIFKNRKKV